MNSKDDSSSPRQSQISTASDSALQSMRVIQFPQFLSQDERDGLFEAVCTNQEAFQQPGIPGYEQEGVLHLSSESDESGQLGAPIRDAYQCLIKRIEGILPKLFTALAIEPFPVPEVRLKLVNGLDGYSGMPHADDSVSRYSISLLHYFHRVPKPF